MKLNFIKFKMIFMQIKFNLSDKIKFKKKKKDRKFKIHRNKFLNKQLFLDENAIISINLNN